MAPHQLAVGYCLFRPGIKQKPKDNKQYVHLSEYKLPTELNPKKYKKVNHMEFESAAGWNRMCNNILEREDTFELINQYGKFITNSN